MNIDSADVITIRMISPSDTPTILRRIDWLNRENDFTISRMDRGEAGEAGSSCFKYEPCATNRNSEDYAAGRSRSPSRSCDPAHRHGARSHRLVAELNQAAAPSPRSHDGAVRPATVIAAVVIGIAVIVIVPGVAQAVAEPDAEANQADAPSEAAAAPACPAPTNAAADARGADAAD